MNDQFEYQKNENYAIIKILLTNFDFFGMDDILDNIMKLLEEINYPNIIIDINQVRYIDSKGLGFFFSIMNVSQKYGKEMLILCNTDEILRIMSMLKVDKIIKIFRKLDDAVNYLKNKD